MLHLPCILRSLRVWSCLWQYCDCTCDTKVVMMCDVKWNTGRVQLRTVKDINLPTSWTRFFWNNLSSDSNSGSSETLKKPYLKFFPWGFRMAKFFGAKKINCVYLFWPFQGDFIYIELSNVPILTPMPSLLLVRRSDAASAYEQPICCFPCQAQPVSAHEMPRLINESMNNFNSACVKIQNSGIFASWNVFLSASRYRYLHQPQYWKRFKTTDFAIINYSPFQ